MIHALIGAVGGSSATIGRHGVPPDGCVSCSVLPMNSAADWIDALQWPAMLVTLAGSWLVASKSRRRRYAGFWVFLGSNVLWVIWALHARAWALLALQIGLACMNIRGERRNEREGPT